MGVAHKISRALTRAVYLAPPYSQTFRSIAQDVWRGIAKALGDSKYFSLQTDETNDISVTQQMAIMLRFFYNTLGSIRCVFFKLESIERATAEQLFQLIDKHIQQSGPLSYDNLIALGTDVQMLCWGSITQSCLAYVHSILTLLHYTATVI